MSWRAYCLGLSRCDVPRNVWRGFVGQECFFWWLQLDRPVGVVAVESISLAGRQNELAAEIPAHMVINASVPRRDEIYYSENGYLALGDGIEIRLRGDASAVTALCWIPSDWGSFRRGRS